MFTCRARAILRTGRAHPSVIFRRRDRLRRSVIFARRIPPPSAVTDRRYRRRVRFASDSLHLGGHRPPLQISRGVPILRTGGAHPSGDFWTDGAGPSGFSRHHALGKLIPLIKR